MSTGSSDTLTTTSSVSSAVVAQPARSPAPRRPLRPSSLRAGGPAWHCGRGPGRGSVASRLSGSSRLGRHVDLPIVVVHRLPGSPRRESGPVRAVATASAYGSARRASARSSRSPRRSTRTARRAASAGWWPPASRTATSPPSMDITRGWSWLCQEGRELAGRVERQGRPEAAGERSRGLVQDAHQDAVARGNSKTVSTSSPVT